jgi:hypothetical protein
MEPAMYQIAATLPTLRPILIKFLSTLSQVSSISRLQKPDGGNSGAVEDTNRDNFVKLDDYHHMHNSKGSKGPGNFSGVLKTTNVSVSSHGIAETDEYKLARHSH